MDDPVCVEVTVWVVLELLKAEHPGPRFTVTVAPAEPTVTVCEKGKFP